MNLNEPDPKKRVVIADLLDTSKAPLPSNHAFGADDLKIRQPDGTVASATNKPVFATGMVRGWVIQLEQNELQQEGDLLLQIASASGVDPWSWVEPVRVARASATDVAAIVAAVGTRAAAGDAMALTGAERAALSGALLDFATAGHTSTGSVGAALTASGGGGGSADTNAIAAAVIAGLLPRTPSSPPTTRVPIYYNVGDLEPPLQLALPFDGVHDTLDEAASAQLRWKKPDGTVSMVDLTISDPVKRIVQRAWSAGDTDAAGVHTGEVVITWEGGRTSTVQTLYQWTVKAQLA